MIIHTPWVDDLCVAPEFAILSVLEATLATTIDVMTASHPEIVNPCAPGEEFTADLKTAVVLSSQARELIATVNRYRLATIEPDPFPD